MRPIFPMFLFLLVSAGCDLGTYSKRYNERVGQMQEMANTNKDLADVWIDVGGGGKIRVPKLCYFDQSFKYGKEDLHSKARLPGIEIAGFQKSFMGDVENGDQLLPFQVYVFFMPSKKPLEAKDEIKVEMRKKFKDAGWETRKVDSYEGKECVWEQMTIAGSSQPFDVYQNNSEKNINLPGRLDLLLTSNDQGTLVIGFRAPADIFGLEQEGLLTGTMRSLTGF